MSNPSRDDLPTIAVSARDGNCPGCGHPSGEQDAESLVWAFVRRMFRMRTLPAACGHASYDDPDYDMSGWSPTPCDCRNPFHGS